MNEDADDEKQDHLMMNVAPDRKSSWVYLQIVLDHRSLRSKDLDDTAPSPSVLRNNLLSKYLGAQRRKF